MLKPNSFLVIIGTDDTRPTKERNPGSQASLQVMDVNPFYVRHHVHQSGNFELFFGERKDSESIDFETPVNGTSITYSVESNRLIVRSDLAGAEPVYYRNVNTTILLSNRLDNLIEQGDLPDWEGIHCYLTFGYTLGASTFFENIQQTLPNQKLKIDTQLLEISKEVSDVTSRVANSETLASNGRTFAKLLSDTMLTYRPMALMMSAGWDSRTLLAPPFNGSCLGGNVCGD